MNNEIKKQLLDLLIEDTKRQINNYKNEMKKAQEEANYHKGAMESRYDTFKEEAQMLKDGYAKQYQALADTLTKLYSYKKNIDVNKTNTIRIGSLVYTYYNDKKRQFYILPDIQYITLNIANTTYECISSYTPLAKKLIGKNIDDEIEFNDDLIEIIEII